MTANFLAHIQNAVVISGSKGIGKGFVDYLTRLPNIKRVLVSTRSIPSSAHSSSVVTYHEVNPLIEGILADFALKVGQEASSLQLLLIATGFLHTETIQPEKSVNALQIGTLEEYFRINAIIPALVLRHFNKLIQGSGPIVCATISAKVGSIEDNGLGGWYGYRASKAALNQFLKTYSIEITRKNPHAIITALHPGTTDTELSKPFQKGVKPEKLFTVERCVRQLMGVIDLLQPCDNGTFLNWDGEHLPW